MKYFTPFALLVSSIILSLFGCQDNSCDTMQQSWGDQYLHEEYSGAIINSMYPNDIKFINSQRDTFQFSKYHHSRYFEKSVDENIITCNNGEGSFNPFLMREVFKVGYSSTEGDSLELIVASHINYLFRSQDELQPNNTEQIGTDRIYVKLSIRGCEAVNTFRRLHRNEESTIIEPVTPVSKFGQLYEDVYGIESQWSNGVILSYSRGIVAFNFCGKNLAQLASI